MSVAAKPVILIFVGRYLPGFKAGGIISCVANIVNHLHGEFDFRIVTRDRDLGENNPYEGIKPYVWQIVGNASVYYLPPNLETASQIRRIINETPHDLLYLNSFFEPLNIKVLINCMLRQIDRAPILLTPHGEFAWPSFCQKYTKKVVFIRLARLLKLYAPVTWHAASTVEAEDAMRVMHLRSQSIHIAAQLPPIVEDDFDDPANHQSIREEQGIRIFFFARISPEKNLDYALKVLGRVTVRVRFDIIGPIENVAYWNECELLIRKLPSHVIVRSVGSIQPAKLKETLRRYDLLLFPSAGEAYGQVIAESLINGTQVLISTNTPWRDLLAKGLGWDLPLNDIDAFVRVIDEVGSETTVARLQRRKLVKENMKKFTSESAAISDVRNLFNTLISRENNSRSA